jgi:hypothetical protein
MSSLKTAIETALGDFVERHTGVRPVLKPSKRAHLASNAFIRGGAERVCLPLNENASECTLFGRPLLKAVRAENGWLLFFFTADVLDAYAGTLPPAPEPDDSFFERRLLIMTRHADAPVPDDPFVLQGFYEVLFSAPRAEETLLSAARHRGGMERVALERRLARVGKLLLWERRKRI